MERSKYRLGSNKELIVLSGYIKGERRNYQQGERVRGPETLYLTDDEAASYGLKKERKSSTEGGDGT